MTLLDEREERILAQARSAFTPGQAQADRVHAAVLAALAVQSGSASASGANGHAGATAAGGKVTSLGLGLSAKGWLAVIAATVGLSSGAVIWKLGRSAPEPHTKTAPAMTASSSPSFGPTPKSSPSASAEAPPPSETALPRPARPSPAQEKLTAPSAPNAKPMRGRLGLHEELAAIRGADESLNAGNPARALAILDDLDVSTGGALREERAALRVLAECQLGTPRALLRAQRFLAAYQSSVYAARVREACHL